MDTLDAIRAPTNPDQPPCNQSAELPDRQVRLEQVRLLYAPSLNAAIASTCVSVALAYVLWPVVDHLSINIWLVCSGMVIMARAVSYFAFFRVNPGLENVKIWETLSISIAVLASLAWASAGIFLFPEGAFDRQAAMTVMLVGMASGAVTTLSALRLPVLLVIPGTMLPLAIQLGVQATDLSVIIAILCVVYMLFLISSANHAYKAHLQNITLLIKSRNEEQAIRKSQEMVSKTAVILQMIAAGQPAAEIYNAIALLYEEQLPGIRCSMLILKGSTLFHGGAPSLPDVYCDAVNGLEIGPTVGSCGTSTYTGKRVLVEDIATDPKWAAIKDFALPHGLRSCWSEPIKTSEGEVLGAFGMYRSYPALPTEAELVALESAARLAGIIMDREQRELLLRKLSASLEQSGEAVVITDTQGAIEYANAAFSKLTGYSEVEAIRDNPSILYNDLLKSSPYSEFQQAAKNGEILRRQVTAQRKNGSLYPAQMTVAPVKNSAGEVTHFISSHSDLTNQNRLEEKLRQKYKMEAVGVMAGGIAHNFNNNLAIILGNLDMARIRSAVDKNLRTHIDNARTATLRSRDLVSQLMSYSRQEGHKRAPTKVAELIDETFNLLRSTIPSTVNLQQDFNDNCRTATINCDSSEVHEALLNLCNNAVQAMDEKGHLTISLDRVELRSEDILEQDETSPKPGPFVKLSVQDSGCGMSAEIMDKIFDPFFTTKEVGRGTGMGLSTVQGTVERHGGLIKVHSLAGQGTTFDLYFPLVSEPLSKYYAPEEDDILPSGNERVLFLDDEEMLVELGKEILTEVGYRVTSSTSSREVLAMFKEDPYQFDLLVTDQTMPEMSGRELITEIYKIRPDLPTIIFSGYSSKFNSEEAQQLGVNAYCSKPMDISAVLKVVRKVLDEAKA